MSFEIERMKKALRAQRSVQPRNHTRSTAIAAALEAHKEKHSVRFENLLAKEMRKLESGAGSRWSQFRSAITSAMNPRYLLAGGVSLVALVVSFGTLELATNSSVDTRLHLSSEKRVTELPQEQLDPPPVQSGDRISKYAVGGQLDAASESSDARARLELPSSSQRVREDIFVPEKNVAQNDFGLVERPRETTLLAPRRVQSVAVRPDGSIMQGKNGFRNNPNEDQARFPTFITNGVKLVSEAPVSTFSIDVDTASYALVRSALERGELPPRNAVRVEEMINYFPYDYPAPQDINEPFRADIAIVPSPWNTKKRLLRIGLKGYEKPSQERPKANLVYLIDTSGSMKAEDKLPLLIDAIKLMLASLGPEDKVSIVTYAGVAGIGLEPTPVSDRRKIFQALDRLVAAGSTAGGDGLQEAYWLAEAHYVEAGINRIILATDGNFNVGISDVGSLKSFIERKRETGISLSVLGFGHGSFNDELMQVLAQNGNGNAAYIDSLNEARKVLIEQASSTIFTIAQDVKIQLEFNPAAVREYRLIGYETRQLGREDFNNDRVDSGDIGAGHTVTALYEFTPAEVGDGLIDPLRYQSVKAESVGRNSNEYAFLKIRYKLPGQAQSRLLQIPVEKSSEIDALEAASPDTRFAVAVAAFSEILKGGRYQEDYNLDDVLGLAISARGEDPHNYRGEFVSLVRLVSAISAVSDTNK